MLDKLIWPVIFGIGTATAGGAAFYLPESLWSNSHTTTIYRKGGADDKTSNLKIGGGAQKEWGFQQNSESLIRVGATGWQNQSLNRDTTQNNALWLAGGVHHLKDSHNWREEMYKNRKSLNPNGYLSLYLTNVDCLSLSSREKFKEIGAKNESQIKFTCQSKSNKRGGNLF